MTSRQQKRILALSADWKSFGFVMFNGPRELMNWGTKNHRSKANVPLPAKLQLLLDENRPDTLVILEPTTPKRTRIVSKLAKAAKTKRIPVVCISKADLRKAFAPMNQNKYKIASAIADQYPELLPQLPTPREDWQSEKFGITIFEAAAAGCVYYGQKITPAN